MNAGRVFLAGMIGAAIMSVILLMARAMGMPARLEMMLGTFFLAPGTGAFLIGLVMHLILGGIFALLYGWVFETLMSDAGLGVGAGLGLGHAVVAGVALGLVPSVHPLIPEVLRAPGPFMSSLGTKGVLAFLLIHVVYGAIVGALAIRSSHPVGA